MYSSIDTSTPLPHALAEQLGERLKQARLNQNITQEQMAKRIGVNRRTVIHAEQGQVTLVNFIAALQVLGLTGQLPLLLPEQPVSPIQLAKLRSAERKRASGHLRIEEPQEDSAW